MSKFSSSSSSTKNQYSGTTVNMDATGAPKNYSPFLIKVLVCAIWGIIGVFVLLNIKPYQQLALMLFGDLRFTSLQNALESIWFIGWIFTFFFQFIDFGIGTIFWAFVQALELIPAECMSNSQLLDRNIQRANKNRYQHDKQDAWEVKIAKRFRNSISTEVLRFLIVVGISVYVIDFLWCLTVFPPVVGGGDVWQLFDVLSLQQFGRIDWGNILKAVATVGAVQFLLKLRRIVVQIAKDIVED